MKYKVKIKDCMLTVRTQAWFTERINERILDVFINMHLRGFLKPKLIRRNVVEYSGPEGVSLFERMQSPIGRHEFFMIVEQILLAERKITAGKLPVGYMVLDPRNVFINLHTHEVQFLYVPTEAPAGEADIVDFMKSVLYLAKPRAEDGDYLTDFVYFLNSMNAYQADRIEQYLLRMDRRAVTTVRKYSMPPSSFLTSQRLKAMEHMEERENPHAVPADSDCPETDVWQQEGDDSATDVWNDDDSCPPTGLMDDNEYPCPPTDVWQDEDTCPPTGLMDDNEYPCPPTDMWQDEDTCPPTGLMNEDDYSCPPTDMWQEEDTCAPTGLMNEDDYSCPPTDMWQEEDTCAPTGLMNEDDYSCPPTGLMHETDNSFPMTEAWQPEEDTCPPTGLMNEDDYSCPPTGLMNEDDDSIACGLSHRQRELAYLVRRSNDERISITDMVFRIGRGGSKVDYAIANNSRIGRSHAEFVFRGRQCYVVDLQSRNGTYINDNPLPPGAEIAIYNGDRLRLADDELVFYQD